MRFPRLTARQFKTHCMQVRDAQTVSYFTKLLRPYGYAVTEHGSRSRKDLDLVFVAWVEDAVSINKLLEVCCADKKFICIGRCTERSRGRRSQLLRRQEDYRAIDVSIVGGEIEV
jgi:hypothetical protein